MMWKFIFDLITDPQPREKLPDINTLSQVVDLLKTCKNILVLTGAGVSFFYSLHINCLVAFYTIEWHRPCALFSCNMKAILEFINIFFL